VSLFRQYAPDECTGRDGYPPEWHATIKHAVREQAGHRCVRCLHPYVKGAGAWSPCDERCTHRGPLRYEWLGGWRQEDGQDILPAGQIKRLIGLLPIEASWRILTVHHLDGDKGNCRWWNLAALCQRCHLEIQGKVRMDRRWLREHSAWFQPYVAGYYAWTFLGEDLTREQVEARLPELLALEDRQLALGDAA
jgi:hypothetical protein